MICHSKIINFKNQKIMSNTKNQDYPKTTNLQQLPDEIREIFIATTNVYQITPDKLWARTRKEEIVDARQTAMSLIYHNYGKGGDLRGYSLKKIGSFFNRDHTTILHSIQKAKDLCDTDDNFRNKYNEINATAKIMARRPRMSNIISIMDSLSIENALFAEKWLKDLLDAQTLNQQTPDSTKKP